MVFPDENYDSTAFTYSNGQYQFNNSAFGADMLRYSWNFAQNWTEWLPWSDQTTMNASYFDESANFWDGQHVIVQCMRCIFPCALFVWYTDDLR